MLNLKKYIQQDNIIDDLSNVITLAILMGYRVEYVWLGFLAITFNKDGLKYVIEIYTTKEKFVFSSKLIKPIRRSVINPPHYKAAWENIFESKNTDEVVKKLVELI